MKQKRIWASTKTIKPQNGEIASIRVVDDNGNKNIIKEALYNKELNAWKQVGDPDLVTYKNEIEVVEWFAPLELVEQKALEVVEEQKQRVPQKENEEQKQVSLHSLFDSIDEIQNNVLVLNTLLAQTQMVSREIIPLLVDALSLMEAVQYIKVDNDVCFKEHLRDAKSTILTLLNEAENENTIIKLRRIESALKYANEISGYISNL